MSENNNDFFQGNFYLHRDVELCIDEGKIIKLNKRKSQLRKFFDRMAGLYIFPLALGIFAPNINRIN